MAYFLAFAGIGLMAFLILAGFGLHQFLTDKGEALRRKSKQ